MPPDILKVERKEAEPPKTHRESSIGRGCSRRQACFRKSSHLRAPPNSPARAQHASARFLSFSSCGQNSSLALIPRREEGCVHPSTVGRKGFSHSPGGRSGTDQTPGGRTGYSLGGRLESANNTTGCLQVSEKGRVGVEADLFGRRKAAGRRTRGRSVSDHGRMVKAICHLRCQSRQPRRPRGNKAPEINDRADRAQEQLPSARKHEMNFARVRQQ